MGVEPKQSEPDCPFCKIAGGDDRSVQVLRSEDEWLAFFPDAPATPGHTLVIPRDHVAHFWALTDHQAGVLAAAAVLTGRAIERALSPDGMNLITSRGQAAEQTVPHVHLHVVPRWADDPVDQIWPPKEPPDSMMLAGVAQHVRNAFGGL